VTNIECIYNILWMLRKLGAFYLGLYTIQPTLKKSNVKRSTCTNPSVFHATSHVSLMQESLDYQLQNGNMWPEFISLFEYWSIIFVYIILMRLEKTHSQVKFNILIKIGLKSIFSWGDFLTNDKYILGDKNVVSPCILDRLETD